MNESEFDDEEFHREHYRNLAEKARAGDADSAWHLISDYVNWVEESPDPSPVVAFLGEFFGALLEIRSEARPAAPTATKLASALRSLQIVPKRGRPSKSDDDYIKRLAAEELIRRPHADGGHDFQGEDAKEYLERFDLKEDRQRNVKAENPELAHTVALLSSTELDYLANDGEVADDIFGSASRKLPKADFGESARPKARKPKPKRKR